MSGWNYIDDSVGLLFLNCNIKYICSIFEVWNSSYPCAAHKDPVVTPWDMKYHFYRLFVRCELRFSSLCIFPISSIRMASADHVDIADLTWEQKERVLRFLFARMNGGDALANQSRKGSLPAIGPPGETSLHDRYGWGVNYCVFPWRYIYEAQINRNKSSSCAAKVWYYSWSLLIQLTPYWITVVRAWIIQYELHWLMRRYTVQQQLILLNFAFEKNILLRITKFILQ